MWGRGPPRGGTELNGCRLLSRKVCRSWNPALTVLALFHLSGCEPPAPEGASDGARGAPPLPAGTVADAVWPVVLVDAGGRPHNFTMPPARILSLVPSANAVLLALGEGKRLVGRTDFDTAGAVAHLPSVGGGLGPDMETVLDLRPDLVIRFAGPSDADTPARLDRAGVAHFAVQPDGIEDVRGIVRQLGALTGRGSAADSLVARIDSVLADVRARVAVLPPVRTAFVLGGRPPWVAGPGSFIDEVLRAAGGVNVFADLDRLYAPVDPEELVAREVDVFLTSPGVAIDARLVEGVPLRVVHAQLEIPGPELGEAAVAVARALHPEAFP